MPASLHRFRLPALATKSMQFRQIRNLILFSVDGGSIQSAPGYRCGDHGRRLRDDAERVLPVRSPTVMPIVALPGVGDERTSAALQKFLKYLQD